ncbi:MAG: hypothetical protein JEY99_16400 [Spirochaetales bacterium]|nr:hypothetical protein [Spirochaetales bacterium]
MGLWSAYKASIMHGKLSREQQVRKELEAELTEERREQTGFLFLRNGESRYRSSNESVRRL